jgi:hypothetical protein
MSRYVGRHRAPRNLLLRAQNWAEFAWVFVRAGSQIFAITILLNSLTPLPHI